MVEKRTCDYTGQEIEPGTGIMYVRTDGTVLHFVDSKAEKNYLLEREPRDLEWTEEGRRDKGPVEEDTPAEPEETSEDTTDEVDEEPAEEPDDAEESVDEPETDETSEDGENETSETTDEAEADSA